MKRFTTTLLLATVASGAMIGAADAQTTIPNRPGQSTSVGNDAGGTDFSLLGVGATSIQNVLVQELNCVGGSNQLGSSNGTLTTVPEPTLSTPSGSFNCASQSLQPNFSGKYVGTGSGFGRQQWRSNSNQFNGTTTTNPFGTWNHVQFAFGDSTLTVTDLNGDGTSANPGYNASVAPYGGPAVQFPKYVLPVAIAYNPVYGNNAGGAAMRFNVTTGATIGGINVGGLRMSRELYCGVFNGQIRNFNDSRFATANGGTTLQDTTNDTAARWSADGVPIRLVGRLDRSGTTDIFTRALQAQCSGFGYTNAYTANAETLPYSRGAANTPDFQAVRADTGLRAASTDPVAGTTNLVSNQYFNGAITSNGVTGGGSPANPTGNQGSGLFLVADGSGRVRDAINFAPDYALNGVTLNGKIGYIGSDFIANSPSGSATLFTAALANRAGSAFLVPSVMNAQNAFSGIRPPQADASSGAFTNTDDRTNRSGAAISRADPLSWYDALYATSSTQTATLANPSIGYPLTGTTQFYGNTCYTAPNREQIVNFLGWNVNAVTRDSANADRTGIFTNTSTGLLARSNIGAMPTAWQAAITQTFLTDSQQTAGGQRLGALNLWLQNQPTPGGNNTANANCSGRTGS